VNKIETISSKIQKNPIPGSGVSVIFGLLIAVGDFHVAGNYVNGSVTIGLLLIYYIIPSVQHGGYMNVSITSPSSIYYRLHYTNNIIILNFMDKIII
jgi:hypothetical protein